MYLYVCNVRYETKRRTRMKTMSSTQFSLVSNQIHTERYPLLVSRSDYNETTYSSCVIGVRAYDRDTVKSMHKETIRLHLIDIRSGYWLSEN